MVPFESMGMVSYSPSILTMAASLAISQIFIIKEWPDLYLFGVVHGYLQGLSYRQQIAVSCAQNTLRASIGINITT